MKDETAGEINLSKQSIKNFNENSKNYKKILSERKQMVKTN